MHPIFEIFDRSAPAKPAVLVVSVLTGIGTGAFLAIMFALVVLL